MIEGITEGLKKEGKVTFVGFGTFTAKKKELQEKEETHKLVKQLKLLLELFQDSKLEAS